MTARPKGSPLRINLALQGGGAHGAYTWGVIDRLLDEPGIEIAGISGTSAGALNGAALKAGLAKGSRDAARENLDWLWDQVGGVGDLRLTHWMAAFLPPPAVVSQAIHNSPGFQWLDTMGRMVSPYAWGPFYRNPLERIVEQFHYDAVCDTKGPRFFVCTTKVSTGKVRVFAGPEVSVPVILASACLPTLFQAVEIADPRTGAVEAYWDGGYTGNPALYPLFAPDLPKDIVVVNINPLHRPDTPRTPTEIQNRINEISFNSSLLRELRAINFVRELIADGRVPDGTFKDVLIHMVADDALMRSLSVATKIVPTPGLLSQLKAAGRTAADAFLRDHGDKIGRQASTDLPAMFG
ncbi:MAG: patatin-like phospholipase family protein [Rhodobacteraceae bacterium]|nr:patatin-like phospholipase family protein [Paracoccaceae bacterium]